MYSKTKIRKSIQKYIYERNRTHYLKWGLCAEWSIRFVFTYDARPQYNMKWILKSHFKKIYIILTKNEAMDYIQVYAKSLEPREYISMTEFGKGYRRMILDPISGVDCYMENKWRQ